MMIILHPTYTVEVILQDRPPITGGLGITSPHQNKYYKDGQTGCDQVVTDIRAALKTAGINAQVELREFNHKS